MIGAHSERWQEYCADTLLDANFDQAIPILLDMIREGARLVKRQACDSLRVLIQGRAAPLAVDPTIYEIVKELAGTSTGIVGRSLQDLLRNLQVVKQP